MHKTEAILIRKNRNISRRSGHPMDDGRDLSTSQSGKMLKMEALHQLDMRKSKRDPHEAILFT